MLGLVLGLWMPRQINRLNARKVQTLTKIGRHADGGGLYLSVAKDGGRKWVFLYRRNGRLREMGLGSARAVPLAIAREKAAAARLLLTDRIDPLAHRQNDVASPNFNECVKQFLASNEAGWRNAKHTSQWRNTLKAYAEPVIGRLPVNEIETHHIMKILDPIWAIKTETASRVRGRIENVIDWASARGYRKGENPARWRGHLDKLLPARSKVQKVEHHNALPYGEIAAFMAELQKRGGIAARALEFTILTAARTSEAIEATRSEFDLIANVWTISAERMKAGREHRVPLSSRAITLLKAVGIHTNDGLAPSAIVFADPPNRVGLSSNAMLALLARLKRRDLTVHGFRSTFRDWAAETTNIPNEVVEMALAHTVKNKAEAAYRRGDLLLKRAGLMEKWAIFCSKPSGRVVPLNLEPTEYGTRNQA